MIFLVSFLIFLAFFGCLALSLIIKGKSLPSESEANAVLEGLSCATCKSACNFAGLKNHNPLPKCSGRDMVIPHKAA